MRSPRLEIHTASRMVQGYANTSYPAHGGAQQAEAGVSQARAAPGICQAAFLRRLR